MSGELPRSGAEWMRSVEGQLRVLNRHNHGSPPAAIPGGGGGGGGGITAYSQLYGPTIGAPLVYGSYRVAVPDGWSQYTFAPPIPPTGIQSTAGEYGWGWLAEGTYHCQVKLDVGILPGSDPLPDYVEFGWDTWTGASLDILIPLFDTISGLDGVTPMKWGKAQATMTSWEPAVGVHNEQSSNSLYFGWKGDGTLTNNSGYTGNIILIDAMKLG